MLRHRITSAVAVATLSYAALACGETKTTEPVPAEPAAPSAPAAPAAAPKMPPAPEGVTIKPDEGGVVHIAGNDQMKFTAARIEAPAGKIKIELKNEGTLPKAAMAHNFIVLKPGSDIAAFGAKAISSQANEYIPADAAEMLGHTKLLGPGESDVLEIELAAGTYPFLCSFPGHFALMRGELVVQ